MTKARQNKKEANGKSRIDPRLVELVKLLARQAAERDYNDLRKQSISKSDTRGV
tara:strand:+ start:361 stop:522 length:162 start_codon:yes stop_codon:yes gene_type:complete